MSLINVDFSGLSEPATKLVEKISDAIGVLYEPTKMKNIAKAQSEVKKIEFQSSIELSDLEERALRRTINSQARKQRNIDSITIKAAKEIDEQEQSDIELLDEDWINHFFNQCEDISDDMMQGLWSRVLTGEAKKNGSFSKRTLNFLSTLDKRDAELITTLGTTVWNQHNLPLPIVFSYEDDSIQKIGLNYDSLRHLESIGVITLGNMSYSVQFEKDFGYFIYYGRTIVIKINTSNKNPFLPKKPNSVDIGMVLLTNIGRELIRICGSKPDEDYFYSTLQEFMEENEVFTPLQ
ncbi:DUF2806 domain-containing protein [Enterobacter hormaechei]|uniref:DUF2806 domain-containing protein n=1 Tax=Enterobacter hormaechei TaxID=158836 RepID=UPI0012B7C3A5|nr:DUF2806 domain-containing protein [Enterobacter hormaechei]